MDSVARLVTFADIRDGGDDPRVMSVSVRHEAVLAGGRRLVLLEDRGWSSMLRIARADGTRDVDALADTVADGWSGAFVADIEATARVVVGPDEPFDGHSQADMEEDHWSALAAVLRTQGVVVDARELRTLPHDVVLSDRLAARTA